MVILNNGRTMSTTVLSVTGILTSYVDLYGFCRLLVVADKSLSSTKAQRGYVKMDNLDRIITTNSKILILSSSEIQGILFWLVQQRL